MVDEKKHARVVRMPQIAESFTEGELVKFLKRPGEAVERDQPIVEVATDKVVVELTATQGGVIAAVVPEGQIVKVGDPMYAIFVAEEAASEPDNDVSERTDETTAGLTEWRQAWDVAHVRARTKELMAPRHSERAWEATLLELAVVRALVAVPSLLARVGHGPPAEVVFEHCEVDRWSTGWRNLSIQPGDTPHESFGRMRSGRAPDAGVRVTQLGDTAIGEAVPARPSVGMAIVLGPAIDEAAVERGAVVVRRRATLTFVLAEALPAEQVRAFANALAEQLQAV